MTETRGDYVATVQTAEMTVRCECGRVVGHWERRTADHRCETWVIVTAIGTFTALHGWCACGRALHRTSSERHLAAVMERRERIGQTAPR